MKYTEKKKVSNIKLIKKVSNFVSTNKNWKLVKKLVILSTNKNWKRQLHLLHIFFLHILFEKNIFYWI